MESIVPVEKTDIFSDVYKRQMLQVGKYPYYLKQRILGDRGHLSNENAGRLLCRLLHDNMKGIFPVSYTHLPLYYNRSIQ